MTAQTTAPETPVPTDPPATTTPSPPTQPEPPKAPESTNPIDALLQTVGRLFADFVWGLLAGFFGLGR